MKNGGSFHSYVTNYQRVPIEWSIINICPFWTSFRLILNGCANMCESKKSFTIQSAILCNTLASGTQEQASWKITYFIQILSRVMAIEFWDFPATFDHYDYTDFKSPIVSPLSSIISLCFMVKSPSKSLKYPHYKSPISTLYTNILMVDIIQENQFVSIESPMTNPTHFRDFLVKLPTVMTVKSPSING